MEGKLNIEIRKSSMEIARDLIKSHIKQPTLEQEIEYSKYIEKYILSGEYSKEDVDKFESRLRFNDQYNQLQGW